MSTHNDGAHRVPPFDHPSAREAFPANSEVVSDLREQADRLCRLNDRLRRLNDRLENVADSAEATLTPLHTIPSAARYLNVSTRKVRHLIANGDLAAITIGERSVRISDENLKAYVRRCAAQGGTR